MALISSDILVAKYLLDKGEIIAIPTETVYGLAGNAYDPKAVSKIFSVKDRPSFDPLIVHTSSLERAKKFILDIPDEAYILSEAFWPGPLTILFNRNDKIPDIVTSGLPTIGVRIPNQDLTLQLLEKLDYPLAAPSANPFGYISPTTVDHVNDQLGDKINYILDGGQSKIGVESTIVGFDGKDIIVYRYGGITIESLEQIFEKVKIKISGSNPKTPGMLENHYAPRTPLKLVNNISDQLNTIKNNVALIVFQKKHKDFKDYNQYILSKSGSLKEAAHNLFVILRKIDKKDYKMILVERLPNRGLGIAINDRLSRAQVKS